MYNRRTLSKKGQEKIETESKNDHDNNNILLNMGC